MFSKSSAHATGYRSTCKDCVSKQELERANKVKVAQPHKVCGTCTINQPIENFVKDKYKADGYHQDCKSCVAKYKEIYYNENKDELRAINKEYGKSHRRQQYERNKKYNKKYPDKVRLASNARKQRDYVKHPDKYKVWRNNYLNNHPEAKLAQTIRVRLRQAIKSNQKLGSAVKDLGCSIQELRQYLELKFQPGMSWDNHSINGWHIDHVTPLSHFDLINDKDQFLQAVHYTNLQPLWAKDNLKKASKLEEN
jgi:hypothetical protein